MALKPSTLGLLMTAILLGGVAYLVAQQGSPPTQEQAAATKLFSFEEDQIQGLTLKTGDPSLVFEKDSASVWQMRSPDQAVANDASIAYLANLLATGMSDRTLTVPASDKESFGLQSPLATIEIKLEDKTTHTLVLGGKNFNQTALYALVDTALVDTALVDTPETATDLSLRLVSPDFENAVSRSLEDWKQSPASSPQGSPSASPIPTESSTPTESPTP